ncbi:APG17-domain-containing protein [Rhizodiscina lignyota]|uniref:Autophagy-related protein 17 n=1 Tax=Rhizodiscina lignyota TaxID=1504668 RepID=A0A9P4IRN0_9PEZI|nr:APG17-domain-containing protein [Rhizodiscina lignyota]
MTPRPSPRPANLPSPTSSDGSLEPPEAATDEGSTLEGLVNYFLASKRSLACTHHVWRANEIVTAAREALEENAVLAAKNAFVKRAISEQITAVEAVRTGVEVVAVEGKDEFKATVSALDVSSTRLNETLEVLRDTEVEPSFQPADEPTKYLFDFVDEGGVTDLHDSIRASIDRFNEAHGALLDHADEFDNAIGNIKGREVRGSGLDLSTEAASPLPSLFQNLEVHATECASLLQSLVRHYDLCVTALKHTEGGGAAIEQATGSLPNAQDLPTGLGLELETMDQDAPPQPMFEEERSDMMNVLAKDAAEVEDVIGEIGDRLADMEEQFQHCENYISALRMSARKLHATLRSLSAVVVDMDQYIAASAEFLNKWDQEKQVLADKMEELESLKGFYENFGHAYDGLVVEVARRRGVQSQMEKVVRDAMNKIEKLYQGDLEEREAFKQDQGEYLPADIWPGLVNPPARFEVVPTAGEIVSVPKVRKEALERAVQRARAKV